MFLVSVLMFIIVWALKILFLSICIGEKQAEYKIF